MGRRFELTDDEWDVVATMSPQPCCRRRDHRQTLNGIVWRVRTGAPWWDAPEHYGPWLTLYERFAAGTSTAPGPGASNTCRSAPIRPAPWTTTPRSTPPCCGPTSTRRSHERGRVASTEVVYEFD
ncbi:transposase [Spongiactinospora gelatinilytica]